MISICITCGNPFEQHPFGIQYLECPVCRNKKSWEEVIPVIEKPKKKVTLQDDDCG